MKTTSRGATSRIAVHHADLVERHAITFHVPEPVPTGDLLIRSRQRIWSELSRIASEWASSEGVVVEIDTFEKPAVPGRPLTWGVKFTIVVGKGVITDDETPPPWTWSKRWRLWFARFRHLDRPDLRVLPGGLADVIPISRTSGQED